jgi:hypothetical protein
MHAAVLRECVCNLFAVIERVQISWEACVANDLCLRWGFMASR